MKKRVLIYSLLSMLIPSIIAMQNDFTPNPEHILTIRTTDGKELPIEYRLLQLSETIKQLIEDTIQRKEDLATVIPIPNITQAEWQTLLPLLKKLAAIKEEYTSEEQATKQAVIIGEKLKAKDIPTLISIINSINYLDVIAILPIAVKIVAEKIEAQEGVVCNQNATSFNKIKELLTPEGAQELCAQALKISVPPIIEKMITKEMALIQLQKAKVSLRNIKQWRGAWNKRYACDIDEYEEKIISKNNTRPIIAMNAAHLVYICKEQNCIRISNRNNRKITKISLGKLRKKEIVTAKLTDNNKLFIVSKKIAVLNIKTGEFEKELSVDMPNQNNVIITIYPNDDGRFLQIKLTKSDENKAEHIIWDVVSDKEVYRITTTNEFDFAVWKPNGSTLAIVSKLPSAASNGEIVIITLAVAPASIIESLAYKKQQNNKILTTQEQNLLTKLSEKPLPVEYLITNLEYNGEDLLTLFNSSEPEEESSSHSRKRKKRDNE